jgi:glycosyltransferase involved in cell wall biosynthesis
MNNPVISVIMTVYNGEAYIEESINSVLNQTYKNFELIIALDGCNDDTEKIVRRLQNGSESIIKVIKHNDKRGCPFRRQELSRLAEGDFIVIQDSDDVSYPNRFEKELLFLKNNPDIFCVGSFADKIDENGEIFGTMGYPPEENEKIIRMITKECKNPIIDPSVMFRISTFNGLGGYSLDREIYTVPDFDLWLRAILSDKKFHNIQEPLTKYRIHNKSVTVSKRDEMIEQHMMVWKRFKKDYVSK